MTADRNHAYVVVLANLQFCRGNRDPGQVSYYTNTTEEDCCDPTSSFHTIVYVCVWSSLTFLFTI